MTDIRNGVNAGKTVTVHDTQITLNGWSGTGYTILDPESGAGAYMIGGGLDGGFLQFMSDNGNYYALAIGILGIVATTAGIDGILLFAVLAISFLVGFLVALGQNLDLLAKGCPKELLIANLLFTTAAFLVGSLAKVFLDALVRIIGGWIYTSIAPSVGNLCKYK